LRAVPAKWQNNFNIFFHSKVNSAFTSGDWGIGV
jgi:hypothetical protein